MLMVGLLNPEFIFHLHVRPSPSISHCDEYTWVDVMWHFQTINNLVCCMPLCLWLIDVINQVTHWALHFCLQMQHNRAALSFLNRRFVNVTVVLLGYLICAICGRRRMELPQDNPIQVYYLCTLYEILHILIKFQIKTKYMLIVTH